jgi:sialidase-1
VPAKKSETQEDVTLALQSIPLGPKRSAVGIYYKEVKGGESAEQMAADWSGPYRVTEKPSAYSTMINLQNGNVGFYYEECDSLNTYGYDMVYKELQLDRITSGNYVK